MKNKTYIVAGCRPWNKWAVEKMQRKFDGAVVSVSTPEELIEAINNTQNIRYVFFFHWSHIVSETITSHHECVCFHMTDVPFGRGGSPLQNLIVRGERKTKLTALRMVSEVDAGPVYMKRDLSLEGSSAEEVYMRADALSCKMAIDIISNEPSPEEQTGPITSFKRRQPEESRIPVEGSLLAVHDFIRMLDAEGYPHAYLELGELRLEFSRSSLYHDKIQAEVTIKRILK